MAGAAILWVLGVLPACKEGGIGCRNATVEARPAVHDEDAQEVIFEAELTDGDRPIAGADVSMAPYTKFPAQDEASVSVHIAAPPTDETGVARTAVSIEELGSYARLRGALQPRWMAEFKPAKRVNDVLYCLDRDDAPIPDTAVSAGNAVAGR